MGKLKCLPQETIVWGHDILQVAAASLKDHGINRSIIFTVDPLEALNRSYIQKNIEQSVGIFTAFPPHVPDIAVREALDASIRLKAESIIALGGGSVLDAAKAVSYLHHEKTGRYLPIVAFPTTLSGAEFSHYFGVTETAGLHTFKRSYAVRDTVPKMVVIDPLLVLDTPRSLLLSSAIKSVDHAVEGMREVGRDHPHAIMGATGVERLFKVLEKWPQNLETRQAVEKGLVSMDDLLQLQLGAWQCYFFPASVIYGLSHRIGHILGGTFGLQHSMTSCITLAPVIRACAEMYGDKLEIFSGACGGANAAADLANRISSAVAALGLPSRLSSLNFDRTLLAQVALLTRENYPVEVNDLGFGATSKLETLLENLW